LLINPVLTPSVSIAASPGTSVCPGTAVTFTATPTNGGTSPTYSWQINGSAVTSNGTNTLTPSSIANGDVVSVIMSPSYVACLTQPMASNSITMNVIAISVDVRGPASICASSPTDVLFLAQNVTGGGNNPVYEWFKNGNQVVASERDTSLPALAYRPTTPLINGDRIYCKITSSDRPWCFAFSNVYVVELIYPAIPSVAIHPSKISYCAGETISFTASSRQIDPGSTYSWKLNGTEFSTSSRPSLVMGNSFVDSGDDITLTVSRLSGICLTAYSADASMTLWGDDCHPNDYNYVLEKTIIKKGFEEEQQLISLATTSYFDGLGRPMQTVGTQSSPSKKDIVAPIAYDPFGRESKKYLPYVSTEINGHYKPTALTDQAAFYNSPPPKVIQDPSPFSETTFEPSPLNRPLKQGAPGTAWQPNADINSMADHTVKKRYELNTAGEVYLFRYDHVSGMVSLPQAVAEKYYQPSQLYANKTYDEHNNDIIEYVDKEGRTVCKKVKASATEYASTYYLYDDFGNLVVVLPPEAVKKITQP
jgi:hypothetical protein